MSFSITINSVYGTAACPENTEWSGENCVQLDTGKPITFTDYSGNAVKKSKPIIEDSTQEIIITKPQHEILADLMIIKPEIQGMKNMSGKALEQKIQNDRIEQTNMTRENYYFKNILAWSTQNAVSAFNKIVFGKEIQNLDFGENNENQIEYATRYNRSEDLVLQQDIIKEHNRAQRIFFINWGNFTNH
jgi:hypothetical protein